MSRVGGGGGEIRLEKRIPPPASCMKFPWLEGRALIYGSEEVCWERPVPGVRPRQPAAPFTNFSLAKFGDGLLKGRVNISVPVVVLRLGGHVVRFSLGAGLIYILQGTHSPCKSSNSVGISLGLHWCKLQTSPKHRELS